MPALRSLSIAGLTAATVILICSARLSMAQIYVKANAGGANNGSSWTDAFTDLQDALAIAVSGDSIWAAAGTYRPTPGLDRMATFELKNDVILYGGFAGTEITLEQRDISNNPTVLSGDIGVPDDPSDNSYHVVNGSGTGASAVLDGFTITKGNADGANPHNLGAGLYNETGSPTVVNTTFTENSANNGAGMFNRNGSSPVVANCVFLFNTAVYGAGISNITNCDAVLTNLTFYGNAADLSGGGINNVGSSPPITNVVVWQNTAPTGPQINNAALSTPLVRHSLIDDSGGSGAGWDPLTGIDGGGNIDEVPMFVYKLAGDLRLTFDSPAINAGDNAAPALQAIDLDGNPRIAGTVVDMGAYEFPLTCSPGPIAHVNPNAMGAGDGSSWVDAYTELRDALLGNFHCANVTEIWVAAGTYNPGTERAATFPMRSNLSLYGGFAGGEITRDQRDWTANPTILSGDIGGPGIADNCNIVVTAAETDTTAVLDGFTVSEGNADTWPHSSGGGMYITGDVTVRRCVLSNNTASSGGGIAVAGKATPTLTDVTLEGNTAIWGGGMYSGESRPVLNRVLFADNVARQIPNSDTGKGGGLYISSGLSNMSPSLTDCRFENNTADYGGGAYLASSGIDSRMENTTFIGNSAVLDGGGIRLNGDAILSGAVFSSNIAGNQGGAIYSIAVNSQPTFTNVSVAGNSAAEGAGIYNNHAQPNVFNSIFSDNINATGAPIVNVEPTRVVTFSFSIVQGSGGSGGAWDSSYGVDGGNNMDTDPLLAAPFFGDLRLRPGSPAINAGNNAAPEMPPADIAGNPRIIDTIVDMGAYEFNGDVTGIDDEDTPVATGRLEVRSVYPNPFNPTVTVAFELDRRRQVKISVYDVQGKLVRTIINDARNAGLHRIKWDASDETGSPVSSGVYFIEVQSNAWRDYRKVILLK